MLVSALIRRVSAEGGNAVVAAKGDPTAGAILLVLMEKGVFTGFRERVLDASSQYSWQPVGPAAGVESQEATAWLTRRQMRDPDLWIIELDIADAERFAAETSGDG